jgi:hypothetical protein
MRRTFVSLSALFATLAIGTAAPSATGTGVTVSPKASGPKFGGLKRAVQCFPGAQRPHEKRPVNLSWDAATPSHKTTYEIFMAKKPGGENFSKPNWSTPRLSFMTPRLPPGRYFVVRARNHAGKEDHNRVQKRAQNPCV